MLRETVRMRARSAGARSLRIALMAAMVLAAGCGARVTHEQKLAARGNGIGAGAASNGSSADNATGGNSNDASGTADASAVGGSTSSGGGTGSSASGTNKATSADK